MLWAADVLIWLTPTSSVIPIDDALVERRMYLALLGLILIGCEVASRLRISQTAGACILTVIGLVFGRLCYDRNQLWGQPDRLLELAAAQAFSSQPFVELHWNLSLAWPLRPCACLSGTSRAQASKQLLCECRMGSGAGLHGPLDEAIAKLQTAARLLPCSEVYELLGLVYGQMGRQGDAGKMLSKAVEIGPNSESAHGSLALSYEKTNNLDAAEREQAERFPSITPIPWHRSACCAFKRCYPADSVHTGCGVQSSPLFIHNESAGNGAPTTEKTPHGV